MHGQTSIVAKNLKDQPAYETCEEGPGAVSDAERDMDKESQAEDADENGICNDGWDIMNRGEVKRAGADFAIFEEGVIVRDQGDIVGTRVGDHSGGAW